MSVVVAPSSGGKRIDSHQPVAFDAWQHLQLILDPQAKTYRVLIQVIAEPPRELCRGNLASLPKQGAQLTFELSCERSQPRPDGPAFDNLRMARKSTNNGTTGGAIPESQGVEKHAP